VHIVFVTGTSREPAFIEQNDLSLHSDRDAKIMLCSVILLLLLVIEFVYICVIFFAVV